MLLKELSENKSSKYFCKLLKSLMLNIRKISAIQSAIFSKKSRFLKAGSWVSYFVEIWTLEFKNSIQKLLPFTNLNTFLGFYYSAAILEWAYPQHQQKNHNEAIQEHLSVSP